ncbi:hypothetical protein HDV64DRAFT_251606 [Trichoderma sp. TUCIM 5745]
MLDMQHNMLRQISNLQNNHHKRELFAGDKIIDRALSPASHLRPSTNKTILGPDMPFFYRSDNNLDFGIYPLPSRSGPRIEEMIISRVHMHVRMFRYMSLGPIRHTCTWARSKEVEAHLRSWNLLRFSY